ncbi:DUF5677 domain-containing protein [Rhizobium sp. 2YAF20]|uniref:DUF5677 domain-containing protein n=1 Tax=Rhizobium sp. 2YAF20 TaxID=3233027 RepID=UPI003F9E0134
MKIADQYEDRGSKGVCLVNPEFAKLVDDAANVKTSGRWGAMDAKIKRLAATPGDGNEWYVQLFGALCCQVFSEYHQLETAYSDGRENASLLAWRARNLLELSVWSKYFTTSRVHARRLYEDAGRDVLDLFSAFEKWGQATAQSTDWLGPLASGKQELSQRAAAEGIETLEGSYKSVAKAAEDCGISDHYRLFFKMLSKFAHPTAMQILGVPDEARHSLQRDFFFSHGCLFFAGAFAALESEASE